MDDKTYTIPEVAIYDPEIKKLKTTDPADADETFNPLVQRLVDNIHAVKQQADELNSRVGTVDEAAKEAKEAAGAAQETADTALAGANAAGSAAESAERTAQTALEAAGTAYNAAGEAKGTAEDALSVAYGAKTAADNAATAASNAQTMAEGALEQLTKLANTLGAVPTQNGVLTYNGSPQSPTLNGYDPEKMTLGGTTSATNAGTHTATIKPKGDYVWADGTQDTMNVTWKINRASVALPSQSGSLTYTGSALSPSWSGYDGAKLTLGGTTSGTNAGSYSASFTPTSNYQWTDGTTGAKVAAWTIGKAAGSLALNKSSMSLNLSSKTGTIAVTRAGDGAISAKSSNTGVATVSVSGTTVTVTGKADGNATITISVAAGSNHTAPESKTCAVSVSIPKIYGVSWDGTSTTKWTRTDDAAGFTDPVPYVAGASRYSSPFDNLQPWSGMVKSTRTGGTMVAIPKFWYKLTKNGNGLKIQIADKATSGFSVSPAHINRGDGKGERSVVYIARYHCGSSAYKSATGQTPKNNITRSAARSAIHALGSNIWQMDFAMRFTLWLLYIVEFADWNTQKTIGKGCGNNSGVQAMGYTDSMPYHTGTTQSSRDTYGLGTQYRNIEGLWDNVLDWCDGCYNNSSGLNIILNPNSFSDSSGGTCVGKPADGWPSAFTVSSAAGFAMFFSSAAGGSETTYSCDCWYFNASNPCVCVGGSYGQSGVYGLFYVDYCGVSDASAVIGARLQELP